MTRSLIALFALSMLAAAPKQGSFLDWGDSPQAYFLTFVERVEWARVLSKDQANQFIAEYWARHGEAFRAELQKRIVAADKYFGLPERRGSETEKGRVFIILGSPNRENTIRQSSRGGGFSTGGSTGLAGPNSLEQGALVVTEWQYKADRLPKELDVPELVVRFQTDISRGEQVIENPGLVDPYLKRAADHYVSRFAAVPLHVANTIWSSAAALNGAYFTGEPFISPTEKSFYAYSFYLPQSVGAFAGANEVLVIGSIKNASGSEVAKIRQPATPARYDATGDRYADGSVELPAGAYSGAFGLYSSDGATLLASSRTDFNVPEPTATRVSRTLLTSHVETLDKQTPFDPFTFVAMKYAVKGNRRFQKSDKIGYFTFIANPSVNPNPSMIMRMKVSKNGRVIDTTPPVPAELTQTGPHTWLLATQFEPNSFRVGHYLLEVQLRDMNAPKTSDAYIKGYVAVTEFDVE
jgi:GWxTD domain-containing protein